MMASFSPPRGSIRAFKFPLSWTAMALKVKSRSSKSASRSPPLAVPRKLVTSITIRPIRVVSHRPAHVTLVIQRKKVAAEVVGDLAGQRNAARGYDQINVFDLTIHHGVSDCATDEIDWLRIAGQHLL